MKILVAGAAGKTGRASSRRRSPPGTRSRRSSSGLDWVVLRPAILTDDPATGSVTVFDPESGEKAHTITRADLAAFMAEQASSDEHPNQCVTIANC